MNSKQLRPNFYHDTELKNIIFNQKDIMQRLRYLRQIHAHAYLSAGVIRNLVWSTLHQQNYDLITTEIDVIFFDPDEKLQQISQQLKQQLTAKFPKNEWDVVNQAMVHKWYKTDNNQSIPAYLSLFDALSMWPETATAIAIRFAKNDALEIIAPFGLDDLFSLKLRWNPRLVSHKVFMQRIESKDFLRRWPKLQFIDQS